MSFAKILTSTKKEGNKYKCRCCKRLMIGNPWMSYNSNGRVRYLCKYLCYKKEREHDDTIWNNLINNNKLFGLESSQKFYHLNTEEMYNKISSLDFID